MTTCFVHYADLVSTDALTAIRGRITINDIIDIIGYGRNVSSDHIAKQIETRHEWLEPDAAEIWNRQHSSDCTHAYHKYLTSLDQNIEQSVGVGYIVPESDLLAIKVDLLNVAERSGVLFWSPYSMKNCQGLLWDHIIAIGVIFYFLKLDYIDVLVWTPAETWIRRIYPEDTFKRVTPDDAATLVSMSFDRVWSELCQEKVEKFKRQCDIDAPLIDKTQFSPLMLRADE